MLGDSKSAIAVLRKFGEYLGWGDSSPFICRNALGMLRANKKDLSESA